MLIFSLDSSVLTDFCNVSEKSVPDAPHVCIESLGETVRFSCQGKISHAFVEVETFSISSSDKFFIYIDFSKFILSFKKFYSGVVQFIVRDTSLDISLDNIKIKLPSVCGKSYLKKEPLLSLVESKKDSVVESLVGIYESMNFSVKFTEGNKFKGVLVDTGSGFTRICKFSLESLFVSVHPVLFEKESRYILSDLMVKSVKSFSNSIAELLFSENKSGFVLNTGTTLICYSPVDCYPSDYWSALGFSSMNLSNIGKSGYCFDSTELRAAVELVSTVLGEAEYWVHLGTLGVEGENLVWEVKGRSFSGVSASESILSSSGDFCEFFSVNKKTFLKVLSAFCGKVVLFNLGNCILIANEESTQAVLLTKALT
jgi:hypothetical protein